MIRVVLTGAECTGKSTLAARLSSYYEEPWTNEFVRTYVDQLDRELIREDLETIAQGQLAQEDEALSQARRIIFHDTNLLSSILYANYFFGEQIEWVNETFLSRSYSIYLLCSPEGVNWQPDPGQRESPEVRAELQKKFKESLIRLELPYLELTGDASQRFGEAIVAIDRLVST
ncbi:MAG: ATP-binding protein [Verrucomicrobiota bacterium]